MEEKELEGIKTEMGKLADLIENSGWEFEAETLAEILRDLVAGDTAIHIISNYSIELEEETGV